MTRRLPNYLEYKRNALINDYRNAKSSDKVKILVEIMDLEEELRYSKSHQMPKKSIL
jgi:hypothetical protein